ncbi:transcriptional regulator [Salmonella enterica]|nr:transcriptional regulator [Salmonella enterica]ECU9525928.1 transcriptional regulator [Salmonella enterica subsp. enterica serovar Sandiego]EAP8457440.1 transcriptional regulator [Salmonella enterica]EBA0364235.1 transcriptional regulator [Salmonella enterica]EBL9675804.1 transcriptional regulator [Salmonella enterica]
MSNQLVFKSYTLEAIDHEGKIWFTAATLASALGYSRGDKITQIYNRNADEFTPRMTLNLNLRVSGKINGLQHKRVRVFSLRGAHLIAMFASTPVAKEFRRWVLDLIEKESAVPQSSTVLAPHRECLPKMVYHHQSKYNPYRAYAWNGEKNVYVGCFPTVDDAVAAQQRFYQNGSTKRIQKIQPEISEAEKEMFIGNLHAVLHNFRRIDEIWRSRLRPVLEAMDSKLVYLLHDRFNDSMCVLPTIERRIGKYIPPELPR